DKPLSPEKKTAVDPFGKSRDVKAPRLVWTYSCLRTLPFGCGRAFNKQKEPSTSNRTMEPCSPPLKHGTRAVVDHLRDKFNAIKASFDQNRADEVTTGNLAMAVKYPSNWSIHIKRGYVPRLWAVTDSTSSIYRCPTTRLPPVKGAMMPPVMGIMQLVKLVPSVKPFKIVKPLDQDRCAVDGPGYTRKPQLCLDPLRPVADRKRNKTKLIIHNRLNWFLPIDVLSMVPATPGNPSFASIPCVTSASFSSVDGPVADRKRNKTKLIIHNRIDVLSMVPATPGNPSFASIPCVTSASFSSVDGNLIVSDENDRFTTPRVYICTIDVLSMVPATPGNPSFASIPCVTSASFSSVDGNLIVSDENDRFTTPRVYICTIDVLSMVPATPGNPSFASIPCVTSASFSSVDGNLIVSDENDRFTTPRVYICTIDVLSMVPATPGNPSFASIPCVTSASFSSVDGNLIVSDENDRFTTPRVYICTIDVLSMVPATPGNPSFASIPCVTSASFSSVDGNLIVSDENDRFTTPRVYICTIDVLSMVPATPGNPSFASIPCVTSASFSSVDGNLIVSDENDRFTTPRVYICTIDVLSMVPATPGNPSFAWIPCVTSASFSSVDGNLIVSDENDRFTTPRIKLVPSVKPFKIVKPLDQDRCAVDRPGYTRKPQLCFDPLRHIC
ncbi:putative WD40 repeat-like protein, partial [Phytophthora infestans]